MVSMFHDGQKAEMASYRFSFTGLPNSRTGKLSRPITATWFDLYTIQVNCRIEISSTVIGVELNQPFVSITTVSN